MRSACRPALICLLVCAALSLRSASPVHAEAASLVLDIATEGSASSDVGSEPRNFFVSGGKAFFLASEESAGVEMWVSDGTANGTKMLADACPGSCSSDVTILGAAHGFVFWADQEEDVHDNPRLWSSDGTPAHTGPLLGPGSNLQLISTDDFVFAGGFLYFRGCLDVDQFCGLWRSDGTEAGTQVVPGTENFYTPPQELAAVGTKVYFAARSGGDSSELWVSDGTSGGTQVLRSFYYVDMPSRLTAAGNKLFFVADQDPAADSDEELWVSDGTAAGTRVVTRFEVHHPFSSTRWLKAVGSQVYFLADDVTHGVEIWRSDGTEAGTMRITEFGTEDPFGEELEPDALALAGNRLVFKATDGLTGAGLWATSGTPGSMVKLADLCAGSCSSLPDYNLLSVGGRVLFIADDGQHGLEVWGTDGTPAGTAMTQDLCPGPCNAILDEYQADRRQLFADGFFVATEAQGNSSHPELQRMNLWHSDGTAAGTRRWTDFAAGSGISSFYFPAAVRLGADMLFSAATTGGAGTELWTSNGRPGGTRLLANLARSRTGSSPADLTVFGGKLYFTACSGRERRLWQSAGSAATTQPVEGAPGGRCLSSKDGGPMPSGLTAAGSQLFFWQLDAGNHWNLWRADGTSQGTLHLLTPNGLSPTREFLTPHFVFAPLGGQVFFVLFGGSFNEPHNQLWKSDGTEEGTRLVFTAPEGSSVGDGIAVLGGAVYFFVNSAGSESSQLWRTDGTPAGTHAVANVNGRVWSQPVRAGSQLYFDVLNDFDYFLWKTDGTTAGPVPGVYANVFDDGIIADSIDWRGVLYFTQNGSDYTDLWRTDGTNAGTVRLRQFQNDAWPNGIRTALVPLRDALYFGMDDGVHGMELWKTDGTGGTVLVDDLFPGPTGSGVTGLTAAGGALYFSADDGVHGFELWKSDGSAAGTRLVQDIAPGGTSAAPEELRALGDRLYFSADDGLTGRELWALSLGAGQGGCVASPTRLCLSGGRFAVEATWKAQGRSGAGMAVPLTADTGYFWFFGPDNVEVTLKVLDGRSVNGHYWVFYGALSNVEYTLTVTDTQTGAAVRYSNLPGRLASIADTQAFGPLGAFGSQSIERAAAASSLAPLALAAERIDPQAATGTCQESASRLCLNGGRFAVEASWKAQQQSGAGKGVKLTGDTGYFWFFDAGNVEVVLKVLDGTGVNGKIWVFYGALSNVEYTLTVTDTQTGKVRTYTNPAGRLASVADTAAF